ncbi:MAG: hypothetical protein AAGD43_22585 [Pseudomonadota bacterium]
MWGGNYSFVHGIGAGALVCVCIFLTSCGTTGVQNGQLATSAVPTTSARLKITRTNDILYVGAAASVEVNGKKVTDIAAGGTTYIDVPAGRQATIAVYTWGYPGKFSLNIKAKPGARYTVEISPREESFVANVSLGIVGAIIDASINENGGAFKLRFVGRTRTS